MKNDIDQNENESNSQFSKEDFLSKLSEASKLGKELAQQGRSITKDGTFITDIVESIIPVVQNLNSAKVDYSAATKDWKNFNYKISRSLNETYNITPVINTIGGTAVSSTDYAITQGIDQYYLFGGNEVKPEIPGLFEYNAFYIYGIFNERIHNLIKFLGLDNPYNQNNSVLEFYDTAIEAYKAPVNQNSPASTSLIPLRSAINEAVGILLLKRPNLTKVKGQTTKEIFAILSQLKYNIISREEVEQIISDWTILNTLLSDSKSKEINRFDWLNRLRTGSSFLLEFLGAIDPSKFR